VSNEALDDWEAARRGFRELHATLDADNLTVRMEALLHHVRREFLKPATNGAGSEETAE
jgi:hypothetical protein